MKSQGIESLPLYPEGRACRRPTARKVIDLFEDVQHHELMTGRGPAEVFTTEADPPSVPDPSPVGDVESLPRLIQQATGNSRILDAR
jgi:hypothetical protein